MARSTDGKGKLGGLFDDLSMAQVVAGALAAVTSMLLASRIGIAGSVIGVAVGSVVSAVVSQLYKKFLTASAEKLRELKPGETGYVPPQGAETPAAMAGGHATADAAETVRLGPCRSRSCRSDPQRAARARRAPTTPPCVAIRR